MSIELVEHINENDAKLINSPKIDGENAGILHEFLVEEEGNNVADNVFNNAIKALPYFVNPSFNSDNNVLSKILAIGRVQSGKTSFFISAIAFAFDNGYEIAYLVGGTKNTLRDQNYDRVHAYFQNNEKVKIFDVNEVSEEKISALLSCNYKLVIVSLKNSADNANLGKVAKLAKYFSEVPSLFVDDEGDEYSPGAPKLFDKTGRIGANHDLIQEAIYSLNHCTYLSVTATPQANFLINTFDAISPDFAVLVNPGESYTGGNSFHDTIDNPHVSTILDTDDFKDSIPNSFNDALNFFIFSCCLKRIQGDYRPFSMLVHPSSLTMVQNAVIEKIRDRLINIKDALCNPSDFAYEQTKNDVLAQFISYNNINPDKTISINPDDFINVFKDVCENLIPFEFNVTETGREDIKKEKEEKALYKIYVGGNMLGRGLTIKNLIVTYIYRDSKVQAVDTLYQRARWLGYKAAYFDVCRVFMTLSLKEKFLAVVENENDMWDSLLNFLDSKTNIKQFPRLFSLSNEKMILTRKTVSKTIVVDRIVSGYAYDKSIWFSDEDKEFNKNLYNEYLSKHLADGIEKCFSTNNYQTHLLIDTTFTEFYADFLSKYHFPKASRFGILGLKKMLKQIEDGQMDDKMTVMIMRFKTNGFRNTADSSNRFIRELPQSYNEGTEYAGDKRLPGFEGKMYFQIHNIYIDENQKDSTMPLLAFNNPLSMQAIRFVTGDNIYDSI